MPHSPWRLILAGIAGAAYLWLGHLGSTSAHPPALSLVSGLLPMWCVALVMAWHARPRGVWLGVLAVPTALILLNLETLRQNTVWLYFIQHAGMHGLLGVMFGRTLFGRHEESFCGRIANFVHNGMSPAMARYTWQVTLAWTLFFFAVTVLSVVMFVAAPLTAWSVFANLLTPPLIGLMFVGEAIVRRRVLPHERHVGILDTIRAYREYSARQSR